MKLLLSGDWQLDSANLDTAAVMIDEISSICNAEKITTLINLGDVKHKYSPIEGRVLNFGVEMVDTFLARGITQHILLGNHDRYGLHTDTASWLPILGKAGAIVHYTPEIFRFTDDTHIAFLPYTTNIAKLKRRADQLSQAVDPPYQKKTILAFHQDVMNCRYNVMQGSESKFTVKDMRASSYLFAIGGHIHLQQNVRKNVWYAGSPFPMDLGECNQRKGYLIVDTDEGTIRQVESKIPRYYDVDWPGFEESKPNSWEGATVRIRVMCQKGDDVQLKVQEAEKEAAQYKGAHLIVIPKFVDEEVSKYVDLEGNEETMLQDYLDKTCPKGFRSDMPRLVPYLSLRLRQAGLTFGKAKKVEFLTIKSRNFLSYKKLDFDFTVPGVTVVTAKNKDWPGRSNGGGKTNFSSLLSVALCGSTFKGQTHDRWHRRKAKKKGYVDLNLKVDGILYRILRTRKPGALKIFDSKGRDISQGNRPTEVQRQLEQLTGFSWETLSSVYVDQRTQNPLLTGTDKERKVILEKIQRLEKFTIASQRVKKDLEDLDRFQQDIEAQQESAIAASTSVREHLAGVSSLIADKTLVRAVYVRKKRELNHLPTLDKQVEKLETLLRGKKEADREVQRHFIHQGVLGGDASKVIGRMKRLLVLEGQQCPTCEQHVQKEHISKIKTELYKQKRRIRAKQQDVMILVEDAKVAAKVLQDEIAKVSGEIQSANDMGKRVKYEYEKAKDAYEALALHEQLIQKLKKQRAEARIEIKRCKEVQTELRREREFMLYCVQVLSRNGLPAHLNRYICPTLNSYAEHYSNIFSDGQIKVRFDVVDGEFEVQVLNLNGGENVADQSEGETRMASLITSFAQRDVISPCNVMILDEPGQGLDSANAQLLAKSINGIGKRIGSILLITHNPYMQAELSDCRHIEIEKRNGVSYIV